MVDIKDPFFSIITPTLQREELERCCRSVTEQSFTGWEHLLVIDCDSINLPLWEKVDHAQRGYLHCEKPHRNWGNSCRASGWAFASGEYVLYLDDDNYLHDKFALERIHDALKLTAFPDWAIFPIHRHGWWFFNDPPGMCMTDTANLVVKREIGAWPDIEAREADGVLVEQLKEKCPYKAFPACEPIVVMEKSSGGV
jgi:glycosyltransferase involved in cell wall biosynthesis